MCLGGCRRYEKADDVNWLNYGASDLSALHNRRLSPQRYPAFQVASGGTLVIFHQCSFSFLSFSPIVNDCKLRPMAMPLSE